MDLWKENQILTWGADTWEETIARQPSPDAIYQDEVVKCIQANVAELEAKGEGHNENKSHICSIFSCLFQEKHKQFR